MAPRALSNRRQLFIVPLVVLSVVLVALVVAIVVVVVVHSGSPSVRRVSGIDPCVVGSWRVAAHREDVTMARFGKVTFTGTAAGATVRLGGDGAGVTDYGSATRFDGIATGHAIRLDVGGKVSYRYAAAGGIVSFRDLVPDAKATLFLDGTKSTELPFTLSTDPADYECSDDRMVFRTDLYETTLARVSSQ